MKKRNLLMAAAVLLMTGCAKEVNLSEFDQTSKNDVGAIQFGTQFKPVTRATSYGADAAELLGGKFVIEGIKGDNSASGNPLAFTAANHQVVFDNYNVEWTANTAGTTASNTHDWEYVGKSFNQNSTVYDASGTQTIKYWDYNRDYYDFVAYSAGLNTQVFDADDLDEDDDDAWDDDKVLVSAIDPLNGSYTVQGNAAALSGFYISDMVTVAYADYNKVVPVRFRSLGSKVRIALYEKVPGYSVRDVKFYTAADGESGTTPAIYSGSANIYSSGTYTVSYPAIGTASSALSDYNKAHVAIAGSTGSASQSFDALDYANSKTIEKSGDPAVYAAANYLGESSDAATYPNSSTAKPYTTVLPNEAGTTLTLRLDYTLVSNDKSGETIEVKNAVAIVPSVYTSWLPGYAYTYIFKISDNTNGTTGTVGTSPEGLYPITLDAVVLDTEDNVQETVTTVATPSITTYQPGVNVSAGNEYAAGTIYVIVDGKTDLGTNGQLYTVTGTGITEATVADALNIIESTSSGVITGRNGIVLTEATSDATITAIPGPDGNDIDVTEGSAASFTATTNIVYAYVYDATPSPAPAATDIYTAVETGTGSDYEDDVRGLYTRDGDTYTAVADGGSEVPPAAGTAYYKHYSNTNKTYAVKVIIVQ